MQQIAKLRSHFLHIFAYFTMLEHGTITAEQYDMKPFAFSLLILMSALASSGCEGDCFIFDEICNEGLQREEGCSIEDIIIDGTNTCAQCVEDGEITSICGEAEPAFCSEFEGPRGDCQVCVTQSGRELYNDCQFNDVSNLNCSATVRRTENGDILDCESCSDDEGRIVSEQCGEISDTCEEGEDCSPQIDPDRCLVYSNEVGECVDCFRGNEIILHACTDSSAEASPLECFRYIDVNGNACEECEGVTQCEEIAEFRCEITRSAFEECLICYNSFNVVDQICEPICSGEDCPQCSTEYVGSGACRVCESESDISRTCTEGGDISCTINATGCVVCGTEDEVLFRDCGDEVFIPVCARSMTDEGEECDVCSDGENVFSTCGEFSPAVGECRVEEITLFEGGEVIEVDNAESVLVCDQCFYDNGSFDDICTNECVNERTCDAEPLRANRAIDGCEPWLVPNESPARSFARFLSENEGVVLIESAYFSANQESCAEECNCVQGVLAVGVSEADAPTLTRYGFTY